VTILADVEMNCLMFRGMLSVDGIRRAVSFVGREEGSEEEGKELGK
jgi:hypothetical protein